MRTKPAKLRLEASSACQLKCPACPNTSNAMSPTIGRGFLTFHDFRRLLDGNRWIREIELSNYGEVFLNPDLPRIIKYAYERNVALTAHNGVNLNNVKESTLESLVKYKFRALTCSIDGASSESYRAYRVGGDFETVIANVKRINVFKQRYRSGYPRLTWQFVVLGHNEHEIPAARELAHQLGMKFRLKLSWDDELSPVRDQDFVRQQVGFASRDEYARKRGVDYMQGICHELWEQPQINWNGKILGCSRNFWGDFGGNAFSDGLLSSINNERMTYARAMLLGNRAPRADIPCTTCSMYLAMQDRGRYVNRGVVYRALRYLSRRLRLGRYVKSRLAYVAARQWWSGTPDPQRRT